MNLGGLSSLIPPQNRSQNSDGNQKGTGKIPHFTKHREEESGLDLDKAAAAGYQRVSAGLGASGKPKSKEAIFQIEVDKIKPNPYQPRKTHNEESLKELAQSIREVGIIQPLVVTKVQTETESGTKVEYQLIAGERRWLAAKMAGLERVPAIIRKGDSNRDQLALALIENIQRANLNPIDTAKAYAKLQDEFGLTQREIAVKVSKSREAVANALRLLNLPSTIQDALAAGKINESQARSLLAISDPSRQEALFHQLLSGQIGSKELRLQARSKKSGSAAGQDYSFWERQLESKFSVPAKIKAGKNATQIVFKLFSPAELKNFLERLLAEENDSGRQF